MTQKCSNTRCQIKRPPTILIFKSQFFGALTHNFWMFVVGNTAKRSHLGSLSSPLSIQEPLFFIWIPPYSLKTVTEPLHFSATFPLCFRKWPKALGKGRGISHSRKSLGQRLFISWLGKVYQSCSQCEWRHGLKYSTAGCAVKQSRMWRTLNRPEEVGNSNQILLHHFAVTGTVKLLCSLYFS